MSFTYEPIIFVDYAGKFLFMAHPEVVDESLNALEHHLKTMPQFQVYGKLEATTLYILSEDSAIDIDLSESELATKQWLTITSKAKQWVSRKWQFSDYSKELKNTREKIYVIAKCQFPRITSNAGDASSPLASITEEFVDRRGCRLENKAPSNAAFIRKALESPSTTAQNGALLSSQRFGNVAAVYDGRPCALTGPSIGIYHPIFSKFRQKVANQPGPVTGPSAWERLRAASRLLDTSAQYFSVEAQRHAALAKDLEILLPSGRFTAKETTLSFGGRIFKPDGHRPTDCPFLTLLLNLLWELKNGMGLGDCDPIEQATRGYLIMATSEDLKKLRDISCMPVFILGITGPNLTISGAIYLDGVVTERLTEYISLVPHSSGKAIDYISDREALVHRIAHIFSVLDECLVDLDEYYQTIESAAPHPLNPAPHFTAYVNDRNELCTLSYTNRRFPPRSQRAVFHATLTSPTEPPRDCIVKFTTRYNAEAHRLMYGAGIAPELIYCQYEPDVDRRCVITEYIHDDLTTIPTVEALEKLKAGLKLLHDNDYVFGDLRDANIIVNGKGHIFLIDFDWCDKVGKAFYPHDLNTTGVTYPAGVEGGHAITKAHDEEMLNLYLAFVEGHQLSLAHTAQQSA
ncbi:hypothetical protein ONZ45_g1631 [Pleurotus djamor]|nr:hypothetical protein ONZ45_g1631 [Pleurotus djamor]